ncbi:Acyl-homoserine-lactone synthase LuxM [Vibrio aerogenes CECT 7868]|uniref:acyl-homoserine-lactone synthase n=3 Tax=Vibrio aerogenes TaxID=92172 RepID=A0A1M6DLN8_9VIBR|nr:Acyl-homoserine-lactone synthase LuxM [Vibrio aerogenes CECT 7868]
MNRTLVTKELEDNFDLEQKKLGLFREVAMLATTSTRHFISRILTTRIKQFDIFIPGIRNFNLAHKLGSPEYQLLPDKIDEHSLSKHELKIETEALQLFDNLAEFWCEFEIYQIQKKYSIDNIIQVEKFNYNEESYSSEIISDVHSNHSLYLTLYEPFPMRLSDALLIINLYTCIKEKKWYEILFSLDMSSYGTHFIMSLPTKVEKLNLIVSTAKINLWNDKNKWLFFSPFFQSSWKLCSDKKIKSHIENIISIDKNKECTFNTIKTFEESLINIISDKSRICEVIRLTVSGNIFEKSYILYLTQKNILKQLNKKNIALAFVVFEQEMALAFYNKLGNNNFLHIGVKDLCDTGKLTHKGLWLIENLCNEFNKYSYKEYKRIYYLQKRNLKPTSDS